MNPAPRVYREQTGETAGEFIALKDTGLIGAKNKQGEHALQRILPEPYIRPPGARVALQQSPILPQHLYPTTKSRPPKG